jgi:hypothetical protein
VASIQVEPVFSGEEGLRPGIVLQVDVDINLEDEFFSYLQAPLLRNRETNGLLKVCYTNAFHTPLAATEKLLSLRTGAGQV